MTESGNIKNAPQATVPKKKKGMKTEQVSKYMNIEALSKKSKNYNKQKTQKKTASQKERAK